MSTLIRHSCWVDVPCHVLQFDWEGERDWGFSFPCDENGNLKDLPEAARENYARCLSNTHDRKVVPRGVISWTRECQPALLRCDCGKELELSDSMTNHCGCGRLFNGSGQQLCDPRLWGEETGERFDASGAPIL